MTCRICFHRCESKRNRFVHWIKLKSMEVFFSLKIIEFITIRRKILKAEELRNIFTVFFSNQNRTRNLTYRLKSRSIWSVGKFLFLKLFWSFTMKNLVWDSIEFFFNPRCFYKSDHLRFKNWEENNLDSTKFFV